jgi:type IV pilus assembly protein PilW
MRPEGIRRASPASRGFTLIEMLVGILIALIGVIIVFNLVTVNEGIKRNTTSVNNAQQSGLLSSFLLGIQLANAGNATANAADDLIRCENPLVKNPVATMPAAYASSWRPIPVMIIDGGAPDVPDAFAVTYSVSNTLIASAEVMSSALAGAGSVQVQSPGGFRKDDLVIAISGAGNCDSYKVTAVSAPDANGIVSLSISPAAANDILAGSRVFNMGPGADPQKIIYDVVNQTLQGRSLVDDKGAPSNAVPTPIASNIVNMKLQYGIDTDADGLLDSWVSATGPWAASALFAADAAKINQIKAVRIAVIVQGQQFDKGYNQDVSWSLFDGVYTGIYARSTSPPGNFRYRTYETTMPLRNEIWNKQ